MGFEIGKLTRLPLGYRGESNARTVEVDISAWVEEFPGAAVDVLVRRPEETDFYPADVQVENGTLTWKISRADVEIAGRGEAQFILTGENDVELHSRVVETIIEKSMSGTEGEVPEAAEGWVAGALQAAQEARDAIGKMPQIGENGNWWLWDEDTAAFVDSGSPAEGVKGPAGPAGPAGEQGPQGEAGPQGPKGDKGDTGPAGAQGAQGPQGEDGPQGPKGDKGDTGATGPQGPAGADGTGVSILGSYDSEEALNAAQPTGSPGDAYLVGEDLYIWSATENKWVNGGTIRGPQGPQGETGPQGPKGDTGETGPQGEKGDKGDKGDTGAQGPKGEAGQDGQDGADGYTPVKGTDYWTEADKQEMLATLKREAHYHKTAVIGTTWEGSGPYTQTVAVEGLLDTDIPIIDLVASTDPTTAEAELTAWAALYRIDTADGSITVYANEATTQAITIQMVGVR